MAADFFRSMLVQVFLFHIPIKKQQEGIRMALKKMKLSFMVAIVMTLVVAGFPIHTVKAENSNSKGTVKDIVANTYIGDGGPMVYSFEIEVNDMTPYQDLKAEDFDITGNYDGYPLNKEGKIAQNNYEDDGIKLSIKDNKIMLDVKAFKYPGGYVSEFEVKNGKYPELSFNKANVSKVNTRTVDDFKAGSFKASNGIELKYRLNLSKAATPQPLVVWLHGGGEVGTDNLKQLTENKGAVVWSESGHETSVLAIQYPENYGWAIYKNKEQLPIMEQYFTAQKELIHKMVAEGKVDKNKIYVVGVSSGGGGVLRFLMQYPDLFAGAITIAAKDTVADYTGSVDVFKQELKNLVDIPLWIIHAEGDPTTDSRTSKLAYQALKELGSTKVHAKFYSDEEMDEMRLYGGLRHWSWAPAFNDTKLIDWLFDQSKSVPYITGFTDGSFKPNAEVTRAQIAAMLAKGLNLKPIDMASDFSDVTTSWAQPQIMQVVKYGVMKGISKTEFAPEQKVTRAQMAVIVSHLLNTQGASSAVGAESSSITFSDVLPTHWANTAIQAAEQAKIMQGYGNGTFKPNAAITRAEAVKVLNLVFHRELTQAGVTPSFNDVPVEHWAYKYIEAAVRP